MVSQVPSPRPRVGTRGCAGFSVTSGEAFGICLYAGQYLFLSEAAGS